MSLDLALDWRATPPQLDVYMVGDVRAVIESRADQVGALPPAATHGLGALSCGGPAGSGEGAALRGRVGVTPPTGGAGVDFFYRASSEGIATPFFMGWAGEPAAVGRISGAEGATVRQVYEAIFADMARRAGPPAPLVFVELIGLFPASEIHDRALKAPVHAAHVAITDAAHAPDYFAFKIIQRDLRERGFAPGQILPLAIVGAGFDPSGAAEGARRIERAAFYAPPQAAGGAAANASPLRTHSHALGWRAAPALCDALEGVARRDDWRAAQRELDRAILPDLLRAPPDYVVHLDEWSRMVGGVVRVFVPAEPERITFLEL